MLSILIISFRKNYKELFTWKKEFYYYRFSASIVWVAWDLMWLFLISSLWLVLSILLWFFWLFFTLLLGYFILKDKPSKKNIILSLLVMVLIWIWYYFK